MKLTKYVQLFYNDKLACLHVNIFLFLNSQVFTEKSFFCNFRIFRFIGLTPDRKESETLFFPKEKFPRETKSD